MITVLIIETKSEKYINEKNHVNELIMIFLKQDLKKGRHFNSTWFNFIF